MVKKVSFKTIDGFDLSPIFKSMFELYFIVDAEPGETIIPKSVYAPKGNTTNIGHLLNWLMGREKIYGGKKHILGGLEGAKFEGGQMKFEKKKKAASLVSQFI
jgi:hypothetical protein